MTDKIGCVGHDCDECAELQAEVKALRSAASVAKKAIEEIDDLVKERDALRADIERYVERDTDRLAEVERLRELVKLSNDNNSRLRAELHTVKCAELDREAKAQKEIDRLLKIAAASGRIPLPEAFV